jgi:hypothetical protein
MQTDMKPIKRSRAGTFAPGGAGDPGRPPRPVERDYIRALSAACPPERWQKIVEQACVLAKGGDAPARAWLSKCLCGDKTVACTLSLTESMLGDTWD